MSKEPKGPVKHGGNGRLDCPICRWGDGSHNSSCWIGALAIKWREAESETKRLSEELKKANLAGGDLFADNQRLRALLAEGPQTWRPVVGASIEPDDEPLQVAVIGGRLVISIGVRTLAFAVANSPDHEGDPIRITDPMAAAKEIRVELVREEEDGTTEVHKLLDRAAFDAWENGGEGFSYE